MFSPLFSCYRRHKSCSVRLKTTRNNFNYWCNVIFNFNDIPNYLFSTDLRRTWQKFPAFDLLKNKYQTFVSQKIYTEYWRIRANCKTVRHYQEIFRNAKIARRKPARCVHTVVTLRVTQYRFIVHTGVTHPRFVSSATNTDSTLVNLVITSSPRVNACRGSLKDECTRYEPNTDLRFVWNFTVLVI